MIRLAINATTARERYSRSTSTYRHLSMSV
jgi:hypothetical protein